MRTIGRADLWGAVRCGFGMLAMDAAREPCFGSLILFPGDRTLYSRQPVQRCGGTQYIDRYAWAKSSGDAWCLVLLCLTPYIDSMKTDKQVYKLLAANPGWFFELTQITDPGRCVFRSVELKDIALSELDEGTKAVLTDVFVSWLEQRFRDKGKQEIEEMLVGALPDLAETQSGKDLIQIGEARGEARGEAKGKREGLLLFLEFRFHDVPETLRQAVTAIQSTAHLDALIRHALQVESLDDFDVTTGAPES